MKSSLVKGALLLRRNLTVLIASFIILNFALPRLPILQHLAPYVFMSRYAAFGLSVILYLACAAQSLLSTEYRKDFERREMLGEIRKSLEECRLNSRNLKRKLELGAQKRLENVIKETEEIVQSFQNGDKNPLKVRVVRQSLNLTSAYIKLADMFRTRAFAAEGDRISQLANRINANTSNLNNVRDAGIADELRRVIEADEKMIESLKNERLELEKIDARLQYMESTIGMLKYNIISNLESEDILNKLESDVTEASALNSVLTERFDERRESRRMRI